MRLVLFLDTPVYLFAERREEHDRTFRQYCLRLCSEIPHFASAGAIDQHDEVKTLALLNECEGFVRGLGACDSGRVTEVEFQVLLRDLHVDTAILLECKTVVVVANEENAPYTP